MSTTASSRLAPTMRRSPSWSARTHPSRTTASGRDPHAAHRLKMMYKSADDSPSPRGQDAYFHHRPLPEVRPAPIRPVPILPVPIPAAPRIHNVCQHPTIPLHPLSVPERARKPYRSRNPLGLAPGRRQPLTAQPQPQPGRRVLPKSPFAPTHLCVRGACRRLESRSSWIRHRTPQIATRTCPPHEGGRLRATMTCPIP